MLVFNKNYALLKLSFFFVKREIKGRVAGSLSGLILTFLYPICLILIFIFLFSFVLKIKLSRYENDTVSFTLFLLVGLIPWIQFQETVLRNASSILENRDAVKKLVFPLSAVIVGYSMAVFLIYLVPIMGIFVYSMYKQVFLKSVSAFKILGICVSFWFLIFTQFLMSLGLGALFASLAVYVRDVLQILSLFFQVWFYLTPIVYPFDMIPDKFKPVISLNPWTRLVNAYRELLLYGCLCSWKDMLYFFCIGVFFFISGVLVFKRLKDGFPDVL